MELVQIQHCVQANLAEKPSVSDLIYWIVLLLFARTFCDWVNDVTKLVRWHEVVDATFYDPAAIADTNTSRSQPKRQSISALPQTAGSRPRIHGRIRAALLTEWELVKNVMARTCVLSSLAHDISTSLSSSIGAAEEASAVRSATIAAHTAARSAARAAATQASHDAAWESSIDAAWFEDDIVGRAGLAYIADHLLSERGLPRSEHAEAMRLIKEGASGYTSPGWMVGCSAGWVIGWRAGRRAARLLVWEKFEDDFPVAEWSDKQEVGWDEAWDRALLSGQTVTGPNIGSEIMGSASYNEAWDAGWSVGWQDGYEAGWEPERERAKRMAVKSWRSARVAAMEAASCDLQNSLSIPEDSFWRGTQNLVEAPGFSCREEWDIILKQLWDKGWTRGPHAIQVIFKEIAQRIANYVDQAVYTPDITLYSRNGGHISKEKQRSTHQELQDYIMGYIRSCPPAYVIGGDQVEVVSSINRIWIQLQDTFYDT
ncbi:hypothetical protein FRC09_014591 [Ceratobasidium sp. 395]|nr:hypothetical protein FRC09_014591 [Ceratobasidium sp. 395]